MEPIYGSTYLKFDVICVCVFRESCISVSRDASGEEGYGFILSLCVLGLRYSKIEHIRVDYLALVKRFRDCVLLLWQKRRFLSVTLGDVVFDRAMQCTQGWVHTWSIMNGIINSVRIRKNTMPLFHVSCE